MLFRSELLRFRIFIPAAFSFVCLLILTVVLFFEQVRSGEQHRQQVSRQSARQIRIPAQRGMIYTRDLKKLTDNHSSFELLFYPGEMRKRKRKDSIRHMLNKADEISEAIGVRHDLTAEKINLPGYLAKQPADVANLDKPEINIETASGRRRQK